MSKKNVVFAPVSKPQEAFLNSNVKFTLYGGAAGAGKSAAVLGSILPLWRHPGTRAIIIRQTTKMLSGAGSLFDAAIQLYTRVDPKLQINTRDLILKFSSGAIVQFTYLDKPNDRLNLQGKEYSFMAFDECQQLSESNVLYALSRLRSTIVDYTPRAVATCNPDYDSFLRAWVEFALDERGIPIRYENGNYPIRYFVNTPTGVRWFETQEEAVLAYT
jgi:phage terminase large subunit